MHPYVESIQTVLIEHADPGQAAPMKRYLRDQFEHLGIKSPSLGKLLKQFYNDHGLPDIMDLDYIVRDLWSLPQREFQYIATSTLTC